MSQFRLRGYGSVAPLRLLLVVIGVCWAVAPSALAAPVQVAQVGVETGWSWMGPPVTAGQDTYFAAGPDGNARLLWKRSSSGSLTQLTEDFPEGGFDPRELTPLGSIVVFTADHRQYGRELWASDGTREGTRMITDLKPGGGRALFREKLVRHGGAVYFTAYDESHGEELWKTDGTAAGTVLVADLNPGSAAGSPRNLIPVADDLYFTATDGVQGYEWWKTDGTSAGTQMVTDITRERRSFFYSRPNYWRGSLYFAAFNRDVGSGLWRFEPSTGEATMIKRVAFGRAERFFPIGRVLYFVGNEEATGTELWRTDGTRVGTRLVRDLRPGPKSGYPSDLTVLGTRLTFAARQRFRDPELWVSDGTARGTRILRELGAGRKSGRPDLLGTVNGRVFFAAEDPAHGRELWSTDGTRGGTRIFRDFFPGLVSSHPEGTTVGDRLWVTLNDGLHGQEPWISDGTLAGTALVADLDRGTSECDSCGRLMSPLQPIANSVLYGFDDGVHGHELWVTDGTASRTRLLKDITPFGSVTIDAFVPARREVLFVADDGVRGAQLWKTNGTRAGTRLVKALGSRTLLRLSGAGELVYLFLARSPDRLELWRSDGTARGTRPVKRFGGQSLDTFFGESYGLIPKAVAIGSRLIFVDGSESPSLWVTNGSARGTRLLAKSTSSSGSAFAEWLTRAGNLVFFRAGTGAGGTRLWRTDGTRRGTRIIQGRHSRGGFPVTEFDGSLLFAARGNALGEELWATAGHRSRLVRDINPGPGGSGLAFEDGAMFNAKAFFAAADGKHGRELWQTDGTAAGTRLVIDIHAGQSGASPRRLTPIGDRMYFTADDVIHGRELWRTDGSVAGTHMVADLSEGAEGSRPYALTAADTQLFFATSDSTAGTGSLWRTAD